MTYKKRVGDLIYHTTKWRKLRKAYYYSQYGICEHCQGTGKIVDHIEPITNENLNDPEITFGWDNLQLLCVSCHNKKTFQKENSIRNGFGFDSKGNLIETK